MDGRIFILLACFSLVVNQTVYCLRRQKRIVGGTVAAKPPEHDPVVFINKRGYTSQILGIRDSDKNSYIFRGIRYGEPPVGRKRFQRSAPVYLEGNINATKWGPPCPQPSTSDPNKIVGSEDCLFLNVFTPKLPDSGEGYPVLIWIHGGGFRRGAACQYEMRNLIRKNMVVVSIQYRLGSLGFLSTGTPDLPGNNGMFDMILAVKWVKDYIEFFGGNPRNIIAFGHGTGASSAIMLSLSNFLPDTFSGLIAMSGSVLSHFTIDKDPSSTAKNIAQKNGCPTNNTLEMVRCLQELPIKKLILTDSIIENLKMTAQGFISGLSNLLGPGPVVEGSNDGRSLPNFITEKPEDSFAFGNLPSIPLLTGVVKDETGGAIFGNYKDEVQRKLKAVPNFLSKELVPNLQRKISNFGNRTRNFVSGVFDKYFGKGGGNVGLEEIAQITGDSLFNVPAFLTVEHWSKKAKTFLYSFDHVGKRNCAKDFLAGLPIVDNKHSPDSTNHGDDLGYLFDPNTIDGAPIINKWTEEDHQIKDVFTDMISQFVSHQNLSLPTKSSGKLLSSIVPTFSGENTPYISISSTPKLMTNFRFCEMGLWTGLTDRLQSSACNFLSPAIQVANRVNDGVKRTFTKYDRRTSDVGNIAPNTIANSRVVNGSLELDKEELTTSQEKTEKTYKEKILSKVPFAHVRLGR